MFCDGVPDLSEGLLDGLEVETGVDIVELADGEGDLGFDLLLSGELDGVAVVFSCSEIGQGDTGLALSENECEMLVLDAALLEENGDDGAFDVIEVFGNIDICKVLGIGVAVNVKTSTLALNSLIFLI